MTDAVETKTVMIDISLIDDPEWNSRLVPTGEDAKEDAEAIKVLGASLQIKQINSITIQGPTPAGRYLLVSGSRRLRAARYVKMPKLRAEVSPLTDSASRIIENALENLQRRDLSLYEQARVCAELRKLGLSLKESSARIGFSQQKVSNLTIMYERLSPAIHKAWHEKHPTATFDFLRQLAGVDGTDDADRFKNQAEAWDARVKLLSDNDDAAGDSDDSGGDSEGDTSNRDDRTPAQRHSVSHDRYNSIVRALKKSKIAGNVLAIECMKALIGQTNQVKGVWKVE